MPYGNSARALASDTARRSRAPPTDLETVVRNAHGDRRGQRVALVVHNLERFLGSAGLQQLDRLVQEQPEVEGTHPDSGGDAHRDPLVNATRCYSRRRRQSFAVRTPSEVEDTIKLGLLLHGRQPTRRGVINFNKNLIKTKFRALPTKPLACLHCNNEEEGEGPGPGRRCRLRQSNLISDFELQGPAGICPQRGVFSFVAAFEPANHQSFRCLALDVDVITRIEVQVLSSGSYRIIHSGRRPLPQWARTRTLPNLA